MQDAAPDSLRRALQAVFARPEYQWTERRRPLLWLWTLWQRWLDWLDTFSHHHPDTFNVLLLALSLVLVGLLLHIAYVIWRIVQPAARAGVSPGAAGVPRLEDARAHLARADELARAGRYAEALGHRFLAAVLELERARALHFHPSKTPAEYVTEARLDPTGRETLAGLVARLYRHLFGAAPCDEQTYRDFGSAAELLTRHVAPV